MEYGRMASLAFIPVVMTLTVASGARGAIYGSYPGLTELIDRADVVAVVRIRKGTPPPMGGYADYEVTVLKTLKGALPSEAMTLGLRYLHHVTEATLVRKQVFLDGEFNQGSQHIVLLETAEGKTATYRSLNCLGGHMRVSPYWRPGKAKDKSVRDTVQALVHDYVRYKRAELRHIEEVAATILGEATESREPSLEVEAAEPGKGAAPDIK